MKVYYLMNKSEVLEIKFDITEPKDINYGRFISGNNNALSMELAKNSCV